METPYNAATIAIIGGGAAGMACALWLKNLGYFPVILERDKELGGHLRHINRVNRWVLGSVGKTSLELANSYAAHINEEAITVLYEARLTSVTAQATGFDLLIDEAGKSRPLSVLALVIATGVRVLGYEMFADIPGTKALCNAGLISFFPLSHIDKLPELKGQAVAVIGGRDNAHYTAKDIALAGAKVYLLIRSTPKAGATIRKETEKIIKQGLIMERTGTQVHAFRQAIGKIEIVLRNANGFDEQITVDRVFVRIGFAANSDFLDNFAALSGIAKETGYISTDSSKRTTIPRVYAIGDVASAKHQSVACAVADGAIAAQDLSERV